jgi:outer membrane receptor protein involved in Fe transport
MPFTDPVLGTTSASNSTGVNDTPSTSGSRTVFSAFAEATVPILSPGMGIPLLKKVELQLAGRHENYSDFGGVTKPRAAIAWDVVDSVRLRASWERGFKAPNLETTSAFTFNRAQTVTDWYRCQAALNKGTITNFSACTFTFGITYAESGNPQLKPDTSESYDFGLVLQPTFISDRLGRFTLTVDRWHLIQDGIVGVISYPTIAVEDYLNRQKGGPGAPISSGPPPPSMTLLSTPGPAWRLQARRPRSSTSSRTSSRRRSGASTWVLPGRKTRSGWGPFRSTWTRPIWTISSSRWAPSSRRSIPRARRAPSMRRRRW